jgi:hypothetical protein
LKQGLDGIEIEGEKKEEERREKIVSFVVSYFELKFHWIER